MASNLQANLNLLLDGTSLEDFVRTRRKARVPWRHIERDLYEVTGGAEVTAESLRTWFPDEVTS